MKVRICFTVDATDDIRRAIRHHYGLDGLATREEVAEWYETNAHGNDDDILYDLQQDEATP